MDIKLINRDTQGELIFIGRLDSQSAPEAQKILDTVGPRFKTIILNLSKLEYTSSAGLRVILKLQVDMNKRGGNLYVRGANKTVMEVFELTGSASFLTFIK